MQRTSADSESEQLAAFQAEAAQLQLEMGAATTEFPHPPDERESAVSLAVPNGQESGQRATEIQALQDELAAQRELLAAEQRRAGRPSAARPRRGSMFLAGRVAALLADADADADAESPPEPQETPPQPPAGDPRSRR